MGKLGQRHHRTGRRMEVGARPAGGCLAARSCRAWLEGNSTAKGTVVYCRTIVRTVAARAVTVIAL